MIIISSVKKSGVPSDALVIPEGMGLPKILTMKTQATGWTEVPFSIIGKPTSVESAFQGLNAITTAPAVDYSECTSFNNITDSCYALKEIDLSSADPSKLVATAWRLGGFGAAALENIINMPVNETYTASNTYSGCFSSLSYLTNISFNGKIGASIDFSGCAFSSGTPLLNIAWALSETNVGTVTFKSGTIGTIMSNAHVKLNEAGDGLEMCNAGDEGDLGTMASYITGKGWTIAYQ